MIKKANEQDSCNHTALFVAKHLSHDAKKFSCAATESTIKRLRNVNHNVHTTLSVFCWQTDLALPAPTMNNAGNEDTRKTLFYHLQVKSGTQELATVSREYPKEPAIKVHLKHFLVEVTNKIDVTIKVFCYLSSAFDVYLSEPRIDHRAWLRL